MTSRAEMWKLYQFRGYRVRVVQQWRDPFGIPFVRIETADDGGAIAEGMAEAAFLQDAAPIDE